MIIAQVLKVSTDLVKVSVNVSQVPWNHPLSLAVPHVLLKGPFKLEDILSKDDIDKDHFQRTFLPGTFTPQDIFSRTKIQGHFVKDIF
jgi:hypothetical protein